jgi:aerobic carbon-monoxide dehydrogenase medium subunit
VDHALELLTRLGPDARLLAGGHSLLPMMKLRLATPAHLIDIDPLADELGYVRIESVGDDGPDEIRIGAMTRHNDLLESELLAERMTVFTDAERVIADPVVRNRGTIGGALCQADPSEDLSAVCAAIGAKLVIRGVAGERVLEMGDFHLAPYRTAVGAAEMLVEIRVPLHDQQGSAYEKVDRRAGDWAVAAGAASIELRQGRIERAGIALAAVGAAITSAEAEAVLVGERPSDELFASAARTAAQHARPVTDQRGSAEYKRHVAAVLTERALGRALARALGTEL